MLTADFPRGYGYLADQVNRASLSNSANIAEGNGRLTKPDLEESAKLLFGLVTGVRKRASLYSNQAIASTPVLG